MIARNVSGWKRDKPDHRDFKLGAPDLGTLPSAVSELPNLAPVNNQGEVGSCTGNAVCEALEFLERVVTSLVVAYSRLFLYFFSRVSEGVDPSNDSGCEIRDVIKTAATVGVCTEATWPYINPETQFSVRPPDAAVAEAAQHKALFYYRCPDLHTAKRSLADGYPVVFGFSVPENFMSETCARTGECLYPSPTEGFDGGHAVLMVGYDDTKTIGDCTGAVLVRNSWGADWGLSGNFWLPYKFFIEGLATDLWTIRRAQV